jgi:hypothetical protein
MTICRRLRQHEFRRRCQDLTPVGLKPFLHEVLATAQNEPNRQRIHLAEPKRCLDQAGHLYRLVGSNGLPMYVKASGKPGKRCGDDGADLG